MEHHNLSPMRRFLANCDDELAGDIIEAFGSGMRIDANALPDAALPCVTILACWLRAHRGVEVMEDYELLVAQMRSVFGSVAHPDLFMASCICIQHDMGCHPGLAGFEAINVPAVWEEMMEIAAPQPKKRRKR